MTGLRNLAANLTLCFVATGASFGSAEYVLYRTGLFEVTGVKSGCHVFSANPKILYELRPGCEDTNSFGMRDREYSLDGEAFRIAVLGDSIAFGPRVSTFETFPKRLEAILGEAQQPVEVLNFGVQGYSTVQEVETLKVKGLPFRPNLVLLQYFLNDEEIYTTIFDLLVMELRNKKLGSYLDALDDRRPALVRYVLSSRVALGLQLLAARLRGTEDFSPPAGQAKEEDWLRAHDNAVIDSYKGRDPVLLGFSELVNLSRKHGFQVAVAIFPYYFDRLESYDQEINHRRAMERCRAFGFHCIDIVEEMKRTEEYKDTGGSKMFVDLCCHLTPYGHEMSAKLIANALKREQLIPKK